MGTKSQENEREEVTRKRGGIESEVKFQYGIRSGSDYWYGTGVIVDLRMVRNVE